MKSNTNKKQAIILIIGVLSIAITYQFLSLLPIGLNILDPIAAIFNLLFTGVLALLILNEEFTEWFKHFSIKWTIIAIPALALTSMICGMTWQIISGGSLTQNTINSVLTWKYVITHTPFMLMGEEFLSITLLFALWKKLNLKFWHASLICAVLFAFWHIASYGYNVPQILIDGVKFFL